MKFLRLYCSISNIHYSRIIELLKLYKSDRERYKDQYSRVLTCFVIWNNRQDVIKQKDARIKELEDENEKLMAIFESVRNLDQYSAQEAIDEICIKFQKARLDYEQFKTKDKE